MFPSRFVRRAIACTLLLLPALSPAASARLSPAQETNLRKALPKTLAKLEKRELIRVVSIGDSITTFYQPNGFPRYDSAMAWQGRLLNFLGGYYFYHGVTDVDPHREITSSQKEATATWARFSAESEIWQRTKKGEAPQAPDTLRFLADLTSPVAMSVPELIRRGVPTMQQIVGGTTIQIHNLARDGAQAAQALEALGPDAFPPAPTASPDLVTICYGINDAGSALPLNAFRGFLEEAVTLCQSHNAEIILAAPPLSFDQAAARASIGRSRPYAQIVKEVAAAKGTAFVDLGAALLEAPSDLASLTATDAFAAAIVPLSRAFSYRSDITDTFHPNSTATLHMGERAARQLLNGPTEAPIQVTGTIDVSSATEATAQLRFFNATKAPRSVVISPLTFTGWQIKPGTPDISLNLAPGKGRRLALPLIPATTGPTPDANSIRASFILSDDDLQQIADVTLPTVPLSLAWPTGRYDGLSGDFLLPALLTNQSPNPVQGIARLHWLGKTSEIPFKLEPKAHLPLPLRLPLPDAATTPRIQETARLELQLPDRTLSFTHNISGLPYLGTKKRLPLISLDQPTAEPDSWVTPIADSRGLYFIMEFPATSSPGAANTSWGIIDLQLDGRNARENGTPGFVDRLTATIPWQDGPVALRKIRPAVFGHTYHYEYNPAGFRVLATTKADGTRRIEFNVARVNLTQHEWSLDGSGQNTLGCNLRISRNDPATNQPSPASTRVIALPSFGGTDARSLTVLELSYSPAHRWSLRVF